MCAIRQLVNRQAGLPWGTVWHKQSFIQLFAIQNHFKFRISCRSNNSDTRSGKLTGERSLRLCFHRSAVIEAIRFCCTNIPKVIIENFFREAVHSSYIQRQNRQRCHLQIPECIHFIVTANGNSTGVYRTLWAVSCQQVAIQEEENRISQNQQLQLVPVGCPNRRGVALCCNIVHIQQLPASISIENARIAATRSGFTSYS